jgi:branched-subunit amino acid transport protein AzlD
MGKWLLTILFLALSTILTRWLPFSEFFRNLDTMIHEFGHAVVTLLLSGEVLYIHLFANHSGVTLSAVSQGWRLIPVSLAGYTTASLFAWYLFYTYRHGNQKQGLAVVTAIGAACLIFFVRNQYGIMWVAGFVVLNLLAMTFGGKSLRNLYFLFIAFLTLEESVLGAVSLAVAGLVTPEQAGDATNLARFTGVPAVVWGVLFAIFALYCAKNALQLFFGRSQGHRVRRNEAQVDGRMY